VTGLAVLLGNVFAGLLWDVYGSFGTFFAGAILACVSLPVLTLISRMTSKERHL